MPTGPRNAALIGAEWTPLTHAELKSIEWVPVPTSPGDVLFFDSYVPHTSKPNFTAKQRRVLYVTYNGQSHGDQRAHYYADKRAAFPPDIDRKPGDEYRYRV
jgi:ectoine hydroxylase-related dioxygenase (phytanoyl-CoA dioxygenase family)